MSGQRLPGPLGHKESRIDKGTSALTAMSKPGSVGFGALIPPIGVESAAVAIGIVCLMGVIDEMERQTSRYLRVAAREGDYLTSPAGLQYIPEDHADAFGHCYMGCQGTKRCGEEMTAFLGSGHETFREAMRHITLGIWGHNSYAEDTFNQAHGRSLAQANPGRDCFDLCYHAVVSGALRFHGHNTSEDPNRVRLYNCSDITFDGREYPQGWRLVPREYVSRLHRDW